MGELEDLIPDKLATTPAGLRAKAEVVLRAMRNTASDCGGPLARPLARDLLQVET